MVAITIKTIVNHDSLIRVDLNKEVMMQLSKTYVYFVMKIIKFRFMHMYNQQLRQQRTCVHLCWLTVLSL